MQVRPARARPVPGGWWRPWLTTATCGPRSPTPQAGWRVFPCIPGEKVPATPHGVKDATTDPAQIRAWWARNPGRNVAIATGAPGPDVLDVDRHGDASGFPALRQLKAAGIVGQVAALVRTPSGGAHLYAPGSEQGNGSLRGHHIDFRSAGGYVVAPPSAVGGRPYVVVSHQAHGDPIDWAKVREHLEPQRERQWEPPARLRDGGQQNLDHLVAQMAGPARGEPQRLPALGRQPGPRSRPGRAAARPGQRRRGSGAGPARGRPDHRVRPAHRAPGPARHPPATRARTAGATARPGSAACGPPGAREAAGAAARPRRGPGGGPGRAAGP